MTVAVHTPTLASKAVKVGGRLYRKQVLPRDEEITYTDPTTGAKRILRFDDDMISKAVQAFNDGAYDTVKFQLADAKNTHTVDPERARGTVRGFESGKDGLDMIVELTADGVKVVEENLDLPVSARIIEDLTRADGKQFPVAIHHVLGTLDPKVPGMTPWQAVDLSADDVPTVDLTATDYPKGTTVTDTATKPTVWAKIGKALGLTDTATEDEIGDKLAERLTPATSGDEPTAEEIAAAVAALEADANAPQEVALTADAQRQINLANTNAEQAVARAAQLERNARKATWERDRDVLLHAGVPKALLDLAAPWCGGDTPTGFIDLANTETTVDAVRAAAEGDMRKLLDAHKGLIDLSVIGEAADPDADAAAAQARQEQIKAHRQRAGI
jgi:hypothetical protein